MCEATGSPANAADGGDVDEARMRAAGPNRRLDGAGDKANVFMGAGGRVLKERASRRDMRVPALVPIGRQVVGHRRARQCGAGEADASS